MKKEEENTTEDLLKERDQRNKILDQYDAFVKEYNTNINRYNTELLKMK